MTITVDERRKKLIAKGGPNKLFGDPDKRQKEMSGEELIELFDQIWDQILKRAINRADVCVSEEAYKRLTDKEKKYFDFDQEHRQFRLKDLNMEFIAQLNQVSEDQLTLTQLWRISSSDINPKTLYVTFESVEQRQQFKKLATRLGWHDEKLGLQLVLDFMSKFPDKYFDK